MVAVLATASVAIAQTHTPYINQRQPWSTFTEQKPVAPKGRAQVFASEVIQGWWID